MKENYLPRFGKQESNVRVTKGSFFSLNPAGLELVLVPVLAGEINRRLVSLGGGYLLSQVTVGEQLTVVFVDNLFEARFDGHNLALFPEH